MSSALDCSSIVPPPCQNFQACLNRAEVLNLHFCFRPEIFAAAARCLLRIVVYIVWIESIYHSESESAEANCWIFFDFDGDKCFLSFCESSLSTVENFYFFSQKLGDEFWKKYLKIIIFLSNSNVGTNFHLFIEMKQDI